MTKAGLKSLVRRIHDDQTGAMSIEKVLLILVIVIPIVVALVAFRKQLMEFFDKSATDVLNEREGGGAGGGAARP